MLIAGEGGVDGGVEGEGVLLDHPHWAGTILFEQAAVDVSIRDAVSASSSAALITFDYIVIRFRWKLASDTSNVKIVFCCQLTTFCPQMTLVLFKWKSFGCLVDHVANFARHSVISWPMYYIICVCVPASGHWLRPCVRASVRPCARASVSVRRWYIRRLHSILTWCARF